MSANKKPSSNKPSGSNNTWSSRASALQQSTTTTRNHSSSTCQVTRAVQTMSLYHNSTYSNILPILRQTFYSKKHFPKILACIMMASGVAGYKCMGWYTERAIEQRKKAYMDVYHRNTNNNNGAVEEDTSNNSNDRFVSLARKMTHRIVVDNDVAMTSPGSQLETNKLQRQVTKFW